MTSYDPGDAVWVRRSPRSGQELTWNWHPAWYVRPHYSERMDVIRFYRHRSRRLVPRSDIRPRDPSLNGDDKPKE